MYYLLPKYHNQFGLAYGLFVWKALVIAQTSIALVSHFPRKAAKKNGLYSKMKSICHPEGPHTQYLGTLVPKTIPLMALGIRVLKYWVLGPSGSG